MSLPSASITFKIEKLKKYTELHSILTEALMDKLLQDTVTHNLLHGVLKHSHSGGRE